MTVHVTDAFALRPTVTYQQTDDEQTFTLNTPVPGVPAFSSTVDLETTLLGISLGAFYYLDVRDRDVRPYAGIEAGYLHRTSEQPTVILQPLPGGTFVPQIDTFEIEEGLVRLDGVLGVQYRPVDRFAIFGEVGIRSEFTDGTSEDDGGTETSGTLIGLLTRAAGLIFYLN
jgi:hypothetical protein